MSILFSSTCVLETLRSHERWLAKEPDGCQAIFRDVDLTGVSFHAADLSQAQFINVKLNHAQFELVKLDAAQFLNVECKGMEWKAISAREVIFENVNATASNFYGVDFCLSKFHSCHFAKASFTRSDLSLSDIDKVNWNGVAFHSSSVIGMESQMPFIQTSNVPITLSIGPYQFHVTANEMRVQHWCYSHWKWKSFSNDDLKSKSPELAKVFDQYGGLIKKAMRLAKAQY